MKTTRLLIFLLFLSVLAKAQEPIPIYQMVLDQWTSESGLISNNLTSVTQSSDGFIWITSFNGALRFDGTKFTLYDKENVPLLSTNAFYSITEGENELYFSSQGSGVLKYSDQEFSQLDIPEVFSVRKTFVDSQENVWLATNNEGVFVHKNDSTRKINHEMLEQILILDIAEDNSGNIWIGTGGNGLLKYENDGSITHYTRENGLPDGFIGTISVDAKGNISIGTQEGAAILRGETFEKIPNTEGIEINKIIEDKDGYLWMGTERGLIRTHPETGYFELFNEESGLPANQVSSVCIDHEGSLWVTTKKAGLIQLKEGSITNISTVDGLSYPRVNIINEHDNQFYIGCDDGSMTILEGNSAKVVNLLPRDNGVGIRDFAFDETGTIWVASYLGLIKYKDGKQKLFNTENGLNSNSVRRVLRARDGTLWMATRTGGVTHMIDEETFYHYDTENSLESNYILAVEQDNEDNIVVGTHSGGISIIKGKEVETFHVPGVTGTLFFNITIDEKNRYWLSTNVGIFCFFDGEFIKVEFDANFKTETFFDLILDDSGNAWSSTNIGIVRISIDDLDAFISGDLEKIPAFIFDHKDGMITKECTGATRSLKTSSGEVWVPTIGGIAKIDPNNTRTNDIIPNVSITSVMVDGEPLITKDIEPGHLRYSLSFASLSYVAANKNEYKYKLEGFDKDWISTRTPEVEYTNLGPGEYTFKVIASNNDGVWNNDGTDIPFKVKPFFYQTIWFYLLIAVGIGMLIYLAFLWRISKVKEVNEKLVKVNEELDRFVYSASHDLRAPLSSILGLVELSKMETTPEGKDECINLIGQSIGKLDNFIKDIIDYSRNQRLELVFEEIEVVNEIEQLIGQLRYLDLNKKIDIQIDSDSEHIVADKRRLTVILKNLIANALIYHDPFKENPFIKVSVKTNESIHIAVEDNGQGIPGKHLPNIFKMFYRAKEDSKGSGLGLYIVKEAVDKVNGKIDVKSQEGKGTTFSIDIPFANN